MDRVKQLENGLNYLINMIDIAVENIEKDSAEKGGPMNPMNYGKLAVYNEVRKICEETLEGEYE